uniref:Uncharacterized protein n=1 Tax=Bombyx mori TaxID=7091 RepID=A0A8R1WMN7_BOMMO|nr:uncharacterized protein LOC101736660 isoform X2 [Bombyx mori]
MTVEKKQNTSSLEHLYNDFDQWISDYNDIHNIQSALQKHRQKENTQFTTTVENKRLQIILNNDIALILYRTKNRNHINTDGLFNGRSSRNGLSDFRLKYINSKLWCYVFF